MPIAPDHTTHKSSFLLSRIIVSLSAIDVISHYFLTGMPGAH